MVSPSLSRVDLVAACRIVLAVLLTEACGYLSGSFIPYASASVGSLWAAASAIVVLSASATEAHTAAAKRVLGTLVGALVGWAYLQFFPETWFGTAACILLTVVVSQYFAVPDNGRLGCVTVLVVLVVSSLHPGIPPFTNAALRFVEAAVGSGVALLVATLWPYKTQGK